MKTERRTVVLYWTVAALFVLLVQLLFIDDENIFFLELLVQFGKHLIESRSLRDNKVMDFVEDFFGRFAKRGFCLYACSLQAHERADPNSKEFVQV